MGAQNVMQFTSRRVAVVGGGINGAGVAWELARRGYATVLFEKRRCGEQTSSRTTKMIHGGLRYLEHMHLALVRESLRERAWLIEKLPELVRPLEILLPVYADSPRSRATIRTGLVLYDALAAGSNIHRHASLSAEEILKRLPLSATGLHGGFSYWDAQVDDLALVRTVIAVARHDGVEVNEMTPVTSLQPDGDGWMVNGLRFDAVVNTAGPWMNGLLAAHGIRARYVLSLVRGSHIVLGRAMGDGGVLLQSVSDRRVFFVLPWKGGTLVGTTEVVHRDPLDDVRASDEEVAYLIERFNRYFRDPISADDVVSSFAGVRPLVGRATNPSAISRDSRIVRTGTLVNVFGGKMTTFMSLARKVAMRVDNVFGKPRKAREPLFL